MPKISCSVVSCSYNQGNICSASILNIVGAEANITEETSCSTYMNKEKVSNAVDDKVKTGEIEAETYRDTDCSSFERRSE